MVLVHSPIGVSLKSSSETSHSLGGEGTAQLLKTPDQKAVQFIQDIFRQATDPTMVIPMLLASPLYHAGRLGLLRSFVARPAETWLGRGLTFNVLPALGGFVSETAGFSLSSRALAHFLQGPVHWDPATLINDTAMTGLSLGFLKATGLAGRKLLQGTLGLKEFQAALWTQADHRALFWGAQLSGYLGLVGSHLLQGRLFPEFHQASGNIWVDALGTHLALGLGAFGGRRVLGAKFHVMEQGLARQANQLSQELRVPPHPSGVGEGLAVAGQGAYGFLGGTGRFFLRGPKAKNPNPLGLFQSEAGGSKPRRRSPPVRAEAVVAAMDRFQGNLTQAARSLKIMPETLVRFIFREGQNAPEGAPLRQWAEWISPEGRARAQVDNYKRMVAALRASGGNLTHAAEKLGIPCSTLETRLEAVRRNKPEYREIVEWAERLSPAAKRRVRIRSWLKMARVFSDRRGNASASAGELGISKRHFMREMDHALASQTISFMESPIRSRFLSVLARWKPGDTRLQRSLQGEPDPAVRLALLVNLLSQSSLSREMLQGCIQNDPDPAVAKAAERALRRSLTDRVLYLLYLDDTPQHSSQVAVSLGISRGESRRLLSRLASGGSLVSLGKERYELSASGRWEAQRIWHENLWDLMDSALESFQGKHTPASRLLGISIRALNKYLQGSFGLVRREQFQAPDRFYHPFQRVPEAHPLHRWKQNIQRKFWSEIARVFHRRRGDGARAAAELEIGEEKLYFEMDRALATQGVNRMESPIRSKLLETLARWHPGDPRVARALEMELDPAVRLSLVQNFFSTSFQAEQLLMDRIENDPREVVSTAASHALQRSSAERVLGILSGNGGIFSLHQVAAALERSPDGARLVLSAMVEKGWLGREGIDGYYLTPAGREAAGQKWRELLWDLLDTAMEETGGHQGNAAPLLGISRHTMHKYLAASVGLVNRSTILGGQHYYGPEYLAPPDHPVRRWRREEFLAGLRDRRRVEQFGEHWKRIDRAMEQSAGVFNEAARILGISDGAVRKHVRIAAGLGEEPLARWGDPDYIQARQDELRRADASRILKERVAYLKNESPYREIPTHRLAAGDPETVPEAIRFELVTRYSVGDERAGRELIRLYDAWITREAKGRCPEEIPLMDMIQAGRLGLLQAAFRHDPREGAKFLTYANYYILKEQVRLIRDHMGTYISGDDRGLMKVMHALQNRAAVQGETLTLDALAAQLEITRERLEQIRMTERAEHTWSLDHGRDEDGRVLHDIIPGESSSGDRQQLRNTFIHGVHEFFNRYRNQGDAVVPPELLIDEFVDEAALAERFAVRLDQVQEQRAQLFRDLRGHLKELGIEEDYFE